MANNPKIEFDLSLGSAVTRVVVRSGGLNDIGSILQNRCADRGLGKVVLVTDDRVGPLYADQVCESLQAAGVEVHPLTVPSGEASKSISQAGELYNGLASAQVDRAGLVLALGGGVVSDLAGFVAATWMRGVRFAICPTTLEADVDACLGGKTAISIPSGKNLVGAFHQPCAVLVDPLCLKTLDARDVCAGLAESVKHALIDSEDFLTWHEACSKDLLSLDDAVVSELIARNLRIKGDIVSQDVQERSGPRLWLNFGHTIGHAIETCSGYALRHGECVSLGMVAACRLGESMDLHNGLLTARLETLLTNLKLPTELPVALDMDQAIATMRLDKKSLHENLRFVLLERVGRPVVKTVSDIDAIRAAVESLAG